MTTNTPWTVGEDDEFQNTPFIPIEMPDGQRACEVYGTGDDLEILPADRDRAAAIVTRWNSHEALKEALRRSDRALANEGYEEDDPIRKQNSAALTLSEAN